MTGFCQSPFQYPCCYFYFRKRICFPIFQKILKILVTLYLVDFSDLMIEDLISVKIPNIESRLLK